MPTAITEEPGNLIHRMTLSHIWVPPHDQQAKNRVTFVVLVLVTNFDLTITIICEYNDARYVNSKIALLLNKNLMDYVTLYS